MMRKTTSSGSILLIFAVLTAGCGPNQRILESANENTATASSEQVAVGSNSAPTPSTFEKDLDSMRTADFKFIVVFRRKDRQPFDAADKELVGKIGSQANRRRLSDEGRAVIIGSNFPFMKGEFDALNARFKMEDYSKPESGPMFSNSSPTPALEF